MDLPHALKESEIRVGLATIPVAILSDGTRLISMSGMTRAIGLPNQEGGKGVLSEETPPFLRLSALKPFISNDLLLSSKPIPFKTLKGRKAYGYRAEILPEVCSVYLDARNKGVLKTDKQLGYGAAAEIIVRGLANVGIIALIDEATGFQYERDQEALQAILDKYLQKELAAWTKKFPKVFFEEIYRLRHWKSANDYKTHPGVVAKYINNLVYDRLAPGILDELQKINPIFNGRRKAHHHCYFTELQGVPALSHHMHSVIKIFKASRDWDHMLSLMDTIHPKQTINDLLLEIKGSA